MYCYDNFFDLTKFIKSQFINRKMNMLEMCVLLIVNGIFFIIFIPNIG